MPSGTRVEFLISRGSAMRLPPSNDRTPAQELHWQMLPHTTIPVNIRYILKVYHVESIHLIHTYITDLINGRILTSCMIRKVPTITTNVMSWAQMIRYTGLGQHDKSAGLGPEG